MKLHELAPPEGSSRPKVRVGRGRAGRRGKTAGRGTKGAAARSQIARHYEGGQIPIQMRLPKRPGFRRHGRVDFAVVNLDALAVFDPGSEVDPAAMRARGLVKKKGPVKVLGRGSIDRPLKLSADAFSATAASKIEAAGGTAEVLQAGKAG